MNCGNAGLSGWIKARNVGNKTKKKKRSESKEIGRDQTRSKDHPHFPMIQVIKKLLSP